MIDLIAQIGTFILFISIGIAGAVFFAVLGKSITRSKKDSYDWLQLGVQVIASVVIAIAVFFFSYNYKLKEHQLAKLQQEKQHQLAKLKTIESLIPHIADQDRRLLALKALELLGYVKEAHTLGNFYYSDDPKVKEEFFTFKPQGMDIKTEMGTVELKEKKENDETHSHDN